MGSYEEHIVGPQLNNVAHVRAFSLGTDDTSTDTLSFSKKLKQPSKQARYIKKCLEMFCL